MKRNPVDAFLADCRAKNINPRKFKWCVMHPVLFRKKFPRCKRKKIRLWNGLTFVQNWLCPEGHIYLTNDKNQTDPKFIKGGEIQAVKNWMAWVWDPRIFIDKTLQENQQMMARIEQALDGGE